MIGKIQPKKKLFKFSDQSGSFEFTNVGEGSNVKKSLLDPNDAFIFDAGNHIYVWVGSKASVGEKKYAMKYAQEYMRTYQRPAILPITSIPQGRESDSFNKAFN